MKIIEVTLNSLRNEIISKTILFDDDTSVDIDIDDNSIIDMEGMTTVPHYKIMAIEKRLKIEIKQ